ncbi:MAG: hypothetical protein KDI16_06510 [Halioglobus sp.]|nr:hypothetical protein [Halioglobus sp.]
MAQSEAPANIQSYALDEVVADLVTLLDVAGVERVAVVGHDWGAIIAWGLVTCIGERASCLVPMSVGTPESYVGCDDIRQKEMGWYTLIWDGWSAANSCGTGNSFSASALRAEYIDLALMPCSRAQSMVARPEASWARRCLSQYCWRSVSEESSILGIWVLLSG